MWVTFGTDENGNPIFITESEDLSTALYGYGQTRATGTRKIIKLSVFAKETFLGYVFATVIDGFIQAITGKTGSDHLAGAIQFFLKKRVPVNRKLVLPSNFRQSLSCSIYPPSSYAYSQCIRSKNGN
jgi:hypothetical protein